MNRYSTLLIWLAFSLLPQAVSAQWENTGEAKVAGRTITLDGDSLRIGLKLDLGSLEVKSGLAVDIIPALQGKDGELLKLPRLMVTGRTRHIVFQRLPQEKKEGIREVRRNNGEAQTVDYVAAVPYARWMGHAHVAVVTDLCGCGWDVLASRALDGGDIRINHPDEYVPSLAYLVPAKEEKVRYKAGMAYLDFPLDKIKIYPDYRDNPAELKKIRNTIDSVRLDKYATITGVSIKGYASPEGPYAHNEYLAEHRAKALSDYVRDLYHFKDAKFDIHFVPEDWHGLDSVVSASQASWKDDVLAIIRDSGIADPDVRHRQLERLSGGEPYRQLFRTVYPALRRSEYKVTYRIRPFTTEEAKALLYTDPKQLSLDEMYRIAQTYERGSREFNEVFAIAVRMYPHDPVANLNAANAALMRKDAVRARACLQKVADGPEKWLAEGALFLLEGDKQKATERFRQAKEAGLAKEADENLDFIRYLP